MNLPVEIAASQRLIVALDFDTAGEARSLVDGLGDTVGFYKVGWQLFLGAGWPFVEDLLEAGKEGVPGPENRGHREYGPRRGRQHA